jgi:hypothetical protein
MVALVRSKQLLDLPDDVLEIVMLNKNPGQLALVCNRFKKLANGDNLYFVYLIQLKQRLGIPGYYALLGRLSIIEGPAHYLKNGSALTLKEVMKEIFIDQKTRIKGYWGGVTFIKNLQVRFENNVFDPFRYVAAEHWIANQDRNRSLRVQKIKERFHCYMPLVGSAACSTAMVHHIKQRGSLCEFPIQAVTAATSAMLATSMFSGITAEKNGQGDSLEPHLIGGVASSVPMALVSKIAVPVSSFYGILASRTSCEMYRQNGLQGSAQFTATMIGISSFLFSIIGSGVNFDEGLKSGELTESQSDDILFHNLGEGSKGTVKGIAASISGAIIGSLFSKMIDRMMDRPLVKKWL